MADKVTVQISFRAGRFYPKGQEVDADDPVVAKYPGMFNPTTALAVRTTASVPGVVTDPDDASSGFRPASNAAKAVWRSYCASLGATGLDDLTKAELVALASELEG